MLNKLNNTRAIAVATLSAICLMAGLARANEGGDEPFLTPVAYIGVDNGAPATCSELREAAWFNHEMERSDGEVSPNVPAVDCRADIYAESTVDAD